MSENELRSLVRELRDQGAENRRMIGELLMEVRGIPEQQRAMLRRIDAIEVRLKLLEDRRG